MTYEKFMKDKFHEARNEAYDTKVLDEIRQNDGVYTVKMLQALRDMAENDVYPDSNFSDIDCNVWSMFRGAT